MAAGSALKKIVARTKQLRKKHPNAKYRTLQKQAGAEYRAGKLKTKRKRVGSSGNTRTSTKAATSRNRTATKTITATVKIGRRKKRRVSSTAGKVGKVRRSRPRVVVIAATLKRRKSAKKKAAPRRRRVGSAKMGMGTLLIGALALGGLYLLTRPKTPQVIYTQNATRNNNAQNILMAAQAAGLTASAIANLIKVLNGSSDEKVAQLAADPQQAARDAANATGDFGMYGVGSYIVR